MMGLPAQPIMSQRMSSARMKTTFGRSAAPSEAAETRSATAASSKRRMRNSLRGVEYEVERRARTAVLEDHADLREGDAVGVLRVALELARNRDNAVLRQRLHFAGVADAVAICVVPERQPIKFLPAEQPIAVIVERSQRVVTSLPEHPEGDVAEQLQRGSDLARLLRIVNQPGGIGVNPRPFLLKAGAIGVEGDGCAMCLDVASGEAVAQRHRDRCDGSRKFLQLLGALLEGRD